MTLLSALDRNHYARSVWEMQSKYAFGFEDFNRYNYLFDRALAVDRLDELLEKRDKFDWTGVHDDSVI